MREFHVLLREWETFYLLIGTAGATLAGLMFVAITIGERITGNRRRLPILRAHSDPALLAFVLCLVLGALFLMPTLNRFWFCAALLGAGVLNLLYIGAVLWQLITGRWVRGWDLSDRVWYGAVPVLSGVLLLVSGGLGLSGQSRLALTMIGTTLLLLLMMGIRNAWDLVTFTMSLMANGQAPGTAPGEVTPELPDP